MKVTAQDLYELGIVDRIVPEPAGGAHSDHPAMAEALRLALVDELDRLEMVETELLLEQRYEKYRRIGTFHES
jgi:acetyl-CoA carboxylase carboxyl transferase subunit alpha